MKKKLTRYLCIGAAVPLLVFGALDFLHHSEARAEGVEADTLLVLVPDNVALNAPDVQEWIDAAKEEGLHLEAVHDSTFVDPLASIHAAGVILPDQLHRMANDVLIGELYRYVQSGGNLMVVYDACTWDLNGRFPPGDARLSDLVGVHYAQYDLYRTTTMEPAQITGTMAAMNALEIPPGSFVPLAPDGKLGLWHQVSERDPQNVRYAFASYQYGAVDYPMFRTTGDFDGTVLLRSRRGLAAGYRQDGLGHVLFVNLPLGYLASRTDGLLLHSFLHFFGIQMLALPQLASVPDGIGGLVFNWHVDAHSSMRPLKVLIDEGVFERGKFSVHFTAGPDVDRFGDHKGLDIEHNPQAQKWIHYLLAHGQTIGSHGGWIHNYFGYHLSDSNQAEFQKYLEWNKDALEHVTGTHIVEYSAPVGNHPVWVTKWLEQHGFIAYYFAGDGGMAPTRVYRNGQRDAPGIWAFPILHMGKEASMEEMGFDDVPIPAVRDWLLAITNFTAHEHTARLIYTHPFGAERFFATIKTWLDSADSFERQGRFRWYTMTELATFLTQRESVQWSFTRTRPDQFLLHGSSPKTLAHDTWVFPHSSYHTARIVDGHADIRLQDGMIFITASGGRELSVELTKQSPHAVPTGVSEAQR